MQRKHPLVNLESSRQPLEIDSTAATTTTVADIVKEDATRNQGQNTSQPLDVNKKLIPHQLAFPDMQVILNRKQHKVMLIVIYGKNRRNDTNQNR